MRFEGPPDPSNVPPEENPQENAPVDPLEPGAGPEATPPIPPRDPGEPENPPDYKPYEPFGDQGEPPPDQEPKSEPAVSGDVPVALAPKETSSSAPRPKGPLRQMAETAIGRVIIKGTSSKRLEERLFGQSATTDVIHNIEADFNNDGNVGRLISELVHGRKTDTVLKEIDEQLAVDTSTHTLAAADKEWQVRSANGHTYRVLRLPLDAGGNEYALQVKEVIDKNRDFARDVYHNRLIDELGRKGELKEPRMLQLFQDLVERGSKSALVDMGLRMEGFRNLQSAMVRLNKQEMTLGTTNEVVQRKGRAANWVGGQLQDAFKFSGQYIPEALKSSLESGVLGAGVLAGMGMMGYWNQGALETLEMLGFATGTGFAARWLTSNLTREGKIHGRRNVLGRIQNALTLPSRRTPQKDEPSLADKLAGDIAKEVGGMHAEAIAVDQRTDGLPEREAVQRRLGAVRLIVREMGQRVSPNAEKFQDAERHAQKWEARAAILTGLTVDGVLTRALPSLLPRLAKIGGALGLGSLFYNAATRRSDFWNFKRAKQFRDTNKKEGTWKGKPRGYQNVLEKQFQAVRGQEYAAMRQRIGMNLEGIITEQMASKSPTSIIERLGKGESIGPTPRDIDWLLGGFNGKDDLILELPTRLLMAREWVHRQIPLSKENARITYLGRLNAVLIKLQKEIGEGTVGADYTKLSERIIAERTEKEDKENAKQLKSQYKTVDEFLYGPDIPENPNGEDLLRVLLLKAGIRPGETATMEQLTTLSGYLRHSDTPKVRDANGNEAISQVLEGRKRLAIRLISDRQAAILAAEQRAREEAEARAREEAEARQRNQGGGGQNRGRRGQNQNQPPQQPPQPVDPVLERIFGSQGNNQNRGRGGQNQPPQPVDPVLERIFGSDTGQRSEEETDPDPDDQDAS